MPTMTPDEVNAFLDSKPGWITLTTIGANGYPHSIPIGYFRVGERVYCGGRAGTQKTKNVERNPKVSLSLESGRSMQDLKGVLIQGDARVVSDPAACLDLFREGSRQRGTPEADLPTEPRPGAVYIEVTPRKVISWDNSKQG